MKTTFAKKNWKLSILSLCVVSFVAFALATPVDNTAVGDDKSVSKSSGEKIKEPPYKPKTKSQLKRELSSMQYYVTQEHGTEKAFKNLYWNNKKEGTDCCVVCKRPLFTSETKYKSGTGWPSFFDPINKSAVGYSRDRKLFYVRTEVHCGRCKAHLGHVFDDGPKPTGKRYCMNSASLKFVETKDEKESSK